MDLFTLALVSHMDTIPANMDLFALLGINNVDTMRERNIDKWLITAIRMLSRSLGAFNLVGIICVKVIVVEVSTSPAASPYSSSSNDTPYSAASAIRLSVSGEDSLRSHLLTAWRLTPS